MTASGIGLYDLLLCVRSGDFGEESRLPRPKGGHAGYYQVRARQRGHEGWQLFHHGAEESPW